MAASSAIARQYRPDGFGVPASGTLDARPATGEAMSYSRMRAYESGFNSNWQREAMSKIISLIEMQHNWDGYGSPPLRRDTGMFALQVLQDVMQPRTPMPAIVPSATGVQFEWHERGIDLELHVSAPYACEIWFEDHTGQHQPVSNELSSDLAPARNAVAVLIRR